MHLARQNIRATHLSNGVMTSAVFVELSDVFPLVKDSYMILLYLMYCLVFINLWVVWMAVSMLHLLVMIV